MDAGEKGMARLRAANLLMATVSLALGAPVPAFAAGDAYVEAQGGPGGGRFDAPCPDGQHLIGLELRMADDVDAARAICGVFSGPITVARYSPVGDWHGGQGGLPTQVMCPPRTPVVIGMAVQAEGVKTVVVNQLALFCGVVGPGQIMQADPSAVVYGPTANYTTDIVGLPYNFVKSSQKMVACPANQIATGIHGRSGTWLDAIGLVCAEPRIRPGIGRINRDKVPPAQRVSICDAAKAARARNAPTAPKLEAQCLAFQNQSRPSEPTIDDALRADDIPGRAGAVIKADPMLVALRSYVAETDRQGFDLGIASSEGQTLWGPGKQKIYDGLSPSGQRGFRTATSFALDRNRNLQLATAGAAIAQADPNLAESRNSDPDPRYWLGFDIAAGIFGDPALGGRGNTQSGPGSLGIREALNPTSQRGFNAAMKLLLR
ncbi:hypothetical protein IAG41_00370 [Sphingomonas sp. JC676]|uniref:hypothetical protein n=1 Tax=Sphingomonas sp. JC676 TaxID=2768065 RepID=UPI0016581FDF|nr:hypothetical protein [Sphingomonas sp. JC676]MBC9030835.1 hypothetical protein [Sphingomonas sp. JC676]